MKVKKKKWIRFRMYIVGAFLVLGFGTVLARAYQLQILEKDRLKTIARAGYIGTTKLPPERGAILDRDGHELALSVEVGSVFSHPHRIKEKTKTARQLAKILREKPNRVLRKLRSQRPFVWVKRQVDPERAERIKALDLEGVGVTTEMRRYYPGREIAAQLIGFVGTDNEGLEGLEKKYESFLSGPQHSLIHMRDALGRPFSINRPIPSGHGMHDVVLTIDKGIQYKAQKALNAAVKKTRAKSGHCLVVNPETGEILAMAVVPEFNPNIFSKYTPGQWRNRVITDPYEPGSTIKAFLLAACLEKGIVTPGTYFNCEQGKFRIGGHTVHDTHKHGVLSVSDIIVNSSNIGAIKIGQKLGYTNFYRYLKKLGFGKKTNINLMGESEGFVRSPKKAKTIDQANLFFGQGLSSTSLQMAMAMSAIANGGNLMKPHVVKAIVNKSNGTRKKISPEVVGKVMKYNTARKVANILEGVVGESGTGRQAEISGFRVAGKTGTAQKVDPQSKRYSRTKYTATFVGFVPVNKPRLVILAMIDEPKGIPYGGVVAGPVFSEVGLWALNYLRVNPQIRLTDRATGARLKTVNTVITKGGDRSLLKAEVGTLPDFRGLGMREVIKEGSSLGLKILLEGTGIAVKQYPKAGSSLKKTRSVKVTFRPPA